MRTYCCFSLIIPLVLLLFAVGGVAVVAFLVVPSPTVSSLYHRQETRIGRYRTPDRKRATATNDRLFSPATAAAAAACSTANDEKHPSHHPSSTTSLQAGLGQDDFSKIFGKREAAELRQREIETEFRFKYDYKNKDEEKKNDDDDDGERQL
eukprot:CAMPEP_0113502082 /NCGR_PEP_ID=MMETSP0014_2-20120614/33341_1 /TAXON_ID=2857 /ORGANISM="Nitzschia sp." /LENGTH=151 /DNA_ID=CAMNT_0000396799 /DNA_START=48 /DNA_END=503 /DNA_ORIENTATION=+ /assembly_acc=CAM_ASM_000159